MVQAVWVGCLIITIVHVWALYGNYLFLSKNIYPTTSYVICPDNYILVLNRLIYL